MEAEGRERGKRRRRRGREKKEKRKTERVNIKTFKEKQRAPEVLGLSSIFTVATTLLSVHVSAINLYTLNISRLYLRAVPSKYLAGEKEMLRSQV